jgi:fucose 4-O-acetylase-like acetyltransferase
MALEEFEKEPISERQRGIIQMRTISNYGMGLFFIVAGFVFMFPTKYTITFLSKYDDALIKMFAIICWIYGAFRVFRGYQKNYFND